MHPKAHEYAAYRIEAILFSPKLNKLWEKIVFHLSKQPPQSEITNKNEIETQFISHRERNMQIPHNEEWGEQTL